VAHLNYLCHKRAIELPRDGIGGVVIKKLLVIIFLPKLKYILLHYATLGSQLEPSVALLNYLYHFSHYLKTTPYVVFPWSNSGYHGNSAVHDKNYEFLIEALAAAA